MPHTQAQAIEILQKAYRAHMRRKRALVAVPAEFLRVPDNFLVSRVWGSDKFYRSLAGSATLVASLNNGNYQLLEYYLQKGIDPRPMLYDAYFIRQSISVDMLDAVSEIKNTADELTRNATPGNQVRVFPLLTKQEKFSEETLTTLIPFLKKLYPLQDEELPLLETYFASVPLGERFFATVDLNQYYRLGALKMVILRMLKQLVIRDQCGLHATICKHKHLLSMPDIPAAELLTAIAESVQRIKRDLYTFRIPMHELDKMLRRAYRLLSSEYDFFNRIDWHSSLYFQIINANVAVCANVQSPNNQLVAQVVLPPRVMEICHEIVYGKNNHVRRLTGFGVFTPHCIVEATQCHSRIINIFSSHVKFAMEAHDSRVGASSMRSHDINHWIRMNAAPLSIRNGIIEWASMLVKETGIIYSKLSYAFLDMDITCFEDLHKTNPLRKSINYNLQSLGKFYAHIIHGYNRLRTQLLDYHLLLFYSILRDPGWMNRTFSHCEEANPCQFQEVLLKKLGAAFDMEDMHYREIRSSYQERLSITQNVFHYFMWDASVKYKLSLAWLEIMFKHILPELNIFHWQRNMGLQIKVGELNFMARDITDNLAIKLISAILGVCNARSKDRIVSGLAHLIQAYEVSNSHNALVVEFKKILPELSNPCVNFLSSLGIFKWNKSPVKTVKAPVVSAARSSYS